MKEKPEKQIQKARTDTGGQTGQAEKYTFNHLWLNMYFIDARDTQWLSSFNPMARDNIMRVEQRY